MTRLCLTLVLISAACGPTSEVARDLAPSAAPLAVSDAPASSASAAADPTAPASSDATGQAASAGPRLAPLPGYLVKLDRVSGPCAPTKDGDAALEKRLEKGDACAAAVLAERLVSRRGLPADYARAMSLFTAALDAGIAVSCWPFGKSDDRVRYARCLQMGDNRGAFALAVAYGDGVPRDLQKARAIAKDLKDESCDATMLTEQLDEAAAAPAGRSPGFCEVAACTTMTMNFCVGELDRIDGFDTSAERGRVVSLMTGAERARYEQTVQALEAYRKVDSERVYLLHIAGTMRNLMAAGRESVLDHELDATVAKIIDRAPLPAATDADLAELSAKIAAVEKQAAIDGTPDLGLDPSAQREYQKALAASTPAYARYERAMVDLAKDRLDEPGVRALRAELRRARLEGLSDEH